MAKRPIRADAPAPWSLVLLGVSVFVAVAGVVALANGVRLARIDGSSMAPTIPHGSWLVTVPAGDVAVGDVVAFRAPNGAPTAHRVEAVAGDGSVTTAGDGNPAVDPWTLPTAVVDRRVVRSVSPGVVQATLSVVLLVLPSLFVARRLRIVQIDQWIRTFRIERGAVRPIS